MVRQQEVNESASESAVAPSVVDAEEAKRKRKRERRGKKKQYSRHQRMEEAVQARAADSEDRFTAHGVQRAKEKEIAALLPAFSAANQQKLSIDSKVFTHQVRATVHAGRSREMRECYEERGREIERGEREGDRETERERQSEGGRERMRERERVR